MSSVGLFVRATHEGQRSRNGEREERGEAESLSGEEVRDFYRSLLTEDRGGDYRPRREERRTTPSQPSGRRGRTGRRGAVAAVAPPGGQPRAVHQREAHRLLRGAQDGDVRLLQDLVGRGCDVNVRDAFYWTPVMCASHAGQREAVRLLLLSGAAWVGVVDTQGRDARDLALLAGHQDVVQELEQFSITETSDNSETPSQDTHSAPHWCATCEVTYTDSARTHTTSTLHQFSAKHPLVAPHYCLPPSSTSYRMMLRSGWDPATGLGPAHTGRRRPIGTVLKQDQAGLGYGPPLQARVTHFQAKDPQAVRQAPKDRRDRKERGVTLTAQALRKRERRERDWERRYRMDFHLDA